MRTLTLLKTTALAALTAGACTLPVAAGMLISPAQVQPPRPESTHQAEPVIRPASWTSPATRALTGLAERALAPYKPVDLAVTGPAAAWPTWCGTSPAPVLWTTSTSAHPSNGTVITVSLAVASAGQGAHVHATMTEAARSCDTDYVTTSPGGTQTTITRNIDTAHATWTVLHVADVIAVVTTTSTTSTTSPNDTIAATLRTLLTQTLQGACLSLEDSDQDTSASRSPYRGTYQPLTRTVDNPAGTVALPRTSTPVAALWSAPSPVPYPQLAPYAPPLPGQTSGDLATAARMPAPTLVPLEQISPPPFSEPGTQTLPQRSTPADKITVPVDDHAGPGCGWAFTATTAPHYAADVSTNARTQALDAVALADAANADWLVSALAQTDTTGGSAMQAAQAKAWDDWRRSRTQALAALNDANRAYRDSLQAWAQLDPTSSATPTPSVSATPTPSVSATPTPSVSASASATPSIKATPSVSPSATGRP